MFVDPAAIVAILTREPEADVFADLIEASPSPIAPPIAIFEAVLGLVRKRHASIKEAEADVLEFLLLTGILYVSVNQKDAGTTARRRCPLWQGMGSLAQLTLGGGLACAMGRTHQVKSGVQRQRFQQDGHRASRLRKARSTARVMTGGGMTVGLNHAENK